MIAGTARGGAAVAGGATAARSITRAQQRTPDPGYLVRAQLLAQVDASDLGADPRFSANPLVIAVPKGRILVEALPLLARAGIRPEAAFGDENSRALRFATDVPHIELIRVRAFDVATFVAHGAAQLGIVGSDVLAEFGYSEL